MDQIAVDTPPGLRQGGEFGQLSTEEIAEQQSSWSGKKRSTNEPPFSVITKPRMGGYKRKQNRIVKQQVK